MSRCAKKSRRFFSRRTARSRSVLSAGLILVMTAHRLVDSQRDRAVSGSHGAKVPRPAVVGHSSDDGCLADAESLQALGLCYAPSCETHPEVVPPVAAVVAPPEQPRLEEHDASPEEGSDRYRSGGRCRACLPAAVSYTHLTLPT